MWDPMSFDRTVSGRIRSVLTILALAVMAACSSAPAQQQPGRGVEVTSMGGGKYFPGESPYAAGVIPEARIHDAQRNRDVVMTIEYPTRGGPYPVIVFSHAYGSSKDAYVSLTEYWVGHGYICIKPSHNDAGTVREPLTRPTGAQGEERGRREGRSARTSGVEVRNVPQQTAPESLWQAQTPAEWQNRTRDITLILDSIDQLEQKYPELAGKIDRARIGVGGDSYGAFTTMLLSGMTSFKTTPQLHPADPRIRAALAVSPQGVSDVFGLTPESWRGVKTPMMFMTGSADRALGENGDPKWRHDPFAYSPAGDKYFISFAGARHSTFAGNGGVISDAEVMRNSRPQTDPWGNPVAMPGPSSTGRGISGVQSSRRVLGSIQLTTIAFWDAYLKNDANALEYLKSDAFLSMNSGGTNVERK
jgi:predicted dienelactone hydrolase